MIREEIRKAGIGILDIKYTSPIARAQASVEAENFSRAVQASQAVFELQPEVADMINGDEVLKGHMAMFGVDAKFRRSESEVRKIREQRQEKQYQLMEQEQQKSNMEVAQGAANIEAQEQPV